MGTYNRRNPYGAPNHYPIRPSGGFAPFNNRGLGLIIAAILISNLITHSVSNFTTFFKKEKEEQENLYLMDKAQVFVHNTDMFEMKVRSVAQELDVPPEWLMAVMYSESKFNAAVKNHKGSGATGLIQWMPETAKDFGTTVKELKSLTHVEQLNYVYMYFKTVAERYGEYNSLTDFYLAVLYPKAREEEFCYTLYANPSEAYKQNSGLDEDSDGRVTIQDIDRRMKRIYPIAYMAEKDSKPTRLLSKIGDF